MEYSRMSKNSSTSELYISSLPSAPPCNCKRDVDGETFCDVFRLLNVVSCIFFTSRSWFSWAITLKDCSRSSHFARLSLSWDLMSFTKNGHMVNLKIFYSSLVENRNVNILHHAAHGDSCICLHCWPESLSGSSMSRYWFWNRKRLFV